VSREGRSQQRPSPIAEGDSARSVLVVCAMILLFAVGLRYSIFGFGYGPLVTARDYDKPVPLLRLAPQPDILPAGFEAAPPCLVTDSARVANVLTAHSLDVPGALAVVTVDYRRGSQGCTLVIVECPTVAAATAVPSSLFTQDTRVVVIVGATGAPYDELVAVVRRHAAEEKRLRVKVAKLRTAGNASFCFLMDLLVGALLFVLALFLAKYFLIIRRVER